MSKVYIAAAKRSAIGSFGGSLASITAAKIGAAVIANVVEESGVDANAIDEVIVGNVLMGNQGMGPGRQAAIYAGIPDTVPAYTVNIICGSGMKSIMLAADKIRLGDADVIVAAGMESMSQAPFYVPGKIRWGNKMGNLNTVDGILNDGLTDVFNDYHMGITAENVARKHSITREQQDAFAAESQKRAAAAKDSGRFTDEIVPVEIKTRKGSVVFDSDEYIKADTTAESLTKLRPAFEKEGTVTAGNASGINDGAAALLLVSEEGLKKHNLTAIAELVAYGEGALDPAYMGLGPVPAIEKTLKKAGAELKDMDLIELNEAFAAQSLGVMTELAADHGVTMDWLAERTNVNGGAIALGHPLGCSGARITVTLLHEMKKRGSSTGLASLCIGGGMGTAVMVKLV